MPQLQIHPIRRAGFPAINACAGTSRVIGLDPSIEMLRGALECFLTADPEKALAVVRRDAEVDLINKQLYRELSSFMIERPGTISRALELMFISKSIERIADHATNIAEEMVFLAQAKDIRHADELKKSALPNA